MISVLKGLNIVSESFRLELEGGFFFFDVFVFIVSGGLGLELNAFD